jgi:hypothetical protein
MLVRATNSTVAAKSSPVIRFCGRRIQRSCFCFCTLNWVRSAKIRGASEASARKHLIRRLSMRRVDPPRCWWRRCCAGRDRLVPSPPAARSAAKTPSDLRHALTEGGLMGASAGFWGKRRNLTEKATALGNRVVRNHNRNLRWRAPKISKME